MPQIAEIDFNTDPALGQTERGIGRYLSGCRRGTEVAIREIRGGRLRLVLTIVLWKDPDMGYVRTEAWAYPSPDWHERTGRNAWIPRGAAHLVEPTPQVRDFAAAFPDGVSWDGTVTNLSEAI